MKKPTLIIAAILACSMFAGCNNTTSGDSSSKDSPVSSVEPSITESGESPVSSDDSSSDELTIDGKTQKLLDEVEFPSMVAVKENNIEVYYGFTKDDFAEYSSYICGSGAMPDEFGIFIAKDEDAAAKIKEGLENRVESQKKTYEDYPLATNEMYKFDDCFVSVNGTTVIYAICADNDRAREILG